MQQQPDPKNRLITILVLYTVFFIGFQFFMFQNRSNPVQAQQKFQAAQKLEQEARTAGNNLARADRIKKLEEAIKLYDSYYNENKSAPDAAQARFNQINIYDYLATTVEGQSSSTHWFDQAEMKLKDMEKSLHNRNGTVQVEVNGQRVSETGDLGEIATRRLNTIRAARDERNEGKITYKVLDFFVRLTGSQPAYSYFLALLIIVVVLKGVTFPFQKKQYQYQRDLLRIQPLVKEMQEQMKGRPQEEVSRRMMQIYKENNVNLAGGCLPMLVLMFVLFPVFWMVRDYEYQFTNGHFLWIGSELSRQFPWIADNLAQFDVPLFIIYTLSTIAYSLLQPKPADPQQAQQQRMMMFMMPVMFGVFMWMYQWSSAFMLYWLILNIVSMYQSWLLMKQFGLNTPEAVNASAGAAAPVVETPLDTMKGVKKPSANGKSGRRANGQSGRIRPRGSERKS